MDENKERDVRVVSVSESTTVTTESTTTNPEHVGGETRVGSVEGCAVQGQMEGGFDSCNGDDIMVEVLGSEVYVGGVCTSGSGENLDDGDGGDYRTVRGVSVDNEVGSERPVSHSVGGDCGGDDRLDSQDVGVSGEEGVKQGMGKENEGTSEILESVEEKVEVAVGVVSREENLEVPLEAEDMIKESQVVFGGDEVQDVENRVDSGAVLGSTGGETEANSVAEKVGVGGGEVNEVGESTDKEVLSGGSGASEEASNKQEVATVCEKAGDPDIKNQTEGPAVDSEAKETHVVEEVAVTGSVEVRSGLANEQGSESMDKEVLSGGSGASEEASNKQEVATVCEKAGDPDIKNWTEGPAVDSEAKETHVVEEVAVTGSVEVRSGLANETVEQDQKEVSGRIGAANGLETQKVELPDEDVNPGAETLVMSSAAVENVSVDTQVEEKAVVISSEVAVTETDATSENLSCSVEKQQVKIEIRGGGENHSTVNAESESSCQPTQMVVESEVTVTDDKVSSVSEQVKSLKPEDYFDKNMAGDIPLVESNSGQDMEVDLQVKDTEHVNSGGEDEKRKFSHSKVPGPTEHLRSEDHPQKSVTCDVPQVSIKAAQEMQVEEKTADAQQVGVRGGQQIEFEKQQETSEKVGGITENDGHGYEDITYSHVPSGVDAEDTAPGKSVPYSSGEGVLPLSSGRDENHVLDHVDIAPMDTDEVLISEIEVPGHSDDDQKFTTEEDTDKNVATDCGASDGIGGEEQVIAADEFGLHGEQELAEVKEVTDSEQPDASEDKITNLESLEPGSSSISEQPSYDLPPEVDGVFSVPNLVWGKVKSHPWWPGQIFDFTDASDKAMKHHKKDCYLVAYFGDRTFAWNEPSTLKSFRTHFSQMEKLGTAESFHNAVNCALEEVSRRVELGLACSCIPQDSYDSVRYQVVENAGIRPESNRREEVDESASARFFQVDKLIEYIKALARSPTGGSNDLELVIAKAQLMAFCRFKGFSSLPEFQFCGDLVENDTAGPRFQDSVYPEEVIGHASPLSKDDEQSSSGQERLKTRNSSYHKRKHNLRDGAYPKIKEKSLTELMGGAVDSPDDDIPSGKRRKGAADNHADELTAQDGRKTISVAKVSNSTPVPKQSFKIGDCIRRVASQLTGSPTAKGNSERVQKLDGSGDRPADGYDVSFQSTEGKLIDPTEYSSLDELLSQLQFIAQDPLKEYNFLNVIVNFFSDFRNSAIAGHHSGTEQLPAEKVGSKRKKGSPETFEFDDMNDTYWTDRVIQNGAEEQPPRRNRKKDQQHGPSQPLKSPQEGRRPYSRKPKYLTSNNALTPEKPAESVNKNAPAQLVMNFSEVKSVPSEASLNRMFRRFGPLKEADTEVDRESSRARVVFKKGYDAEIAHSSAAKFNIFGPTHVNYELSYAPVVQFKPTPVAITQDHEMQLDLSAHDHEMQLDLSTHEHEMHLDLSGHDHDLQLDLSAFEVNLV